MSSSPPSSTRPSDATLEQALRYAVKKVYKSGNLENLTVKRVRKTVEDELDLEDDFLKMHATWATKSKLVIQEEVDAQAEVGETSSLPTLSQHATSPPKPQDQHRKPKGTKRASTEKAEPNKRRKENDSDGDSSTRAVQAPKRNLVSNTKAQRKIQTQKLDDSEAEDQASEADDTNAESDFAEHNGKAPREWDAKRDRPGLDSKEGEEEEDVKPAKSKRNGVMGRGERVAKKKSPKERAPKKLAAKAKTAKRSSPSLSSEAEEAEDTIPIVQAPRSPLNELAEQPQPKSGISTLVDERSAAKGSRRSNKAEPKTKKPKPAKPKEPLEQPEIPENPPKVEESDSSMSILIDEPPKPKPNRKSGSAPPTSKKTKTTKSKRPIDAPSNPELEEIKRLQSQLVKCGIRKIWAKELAPYPSSKSKIKRLKGMLADAGMTGRFSESKAEQIREERELRADLEAVQEGERKWGKVEEDGGSTGPKRRLARGLEGLDFLNDDDGEETD